MNNPNPVPALTLGAYLPSLPTMGFAGNLSTLSLEEVFQTINRIRGTGVLRLASSEAGRDVVFKDGEIIGVSFRQGEERMALLRRLILQGRINATDAAAISSAARDGAAVIEALIARGMISAEEAREGIQQQSEDELLNLCTWAYADFVFQDAGPNDQDASDLVAHFAPHALKISVNSLLMESARRHDEWERIKADAPNDQDVIGSAADRETQLAELSKNYPASAVIPLIDGVRTTTDIVHDAVVTRLDVLEILADLKRDGLIVAFSRDDMLTHADWRLEQSDFINAARLYRRVLSTSPDDKAVHAKLAEALEGQGDNPEAAGCFSQLALGWLAEKDNDNALSAALRATSLASNDPQLRLILVRCLLAQNEQGEAVNELHRVVKRFLELGQLEDARGTCLKILDIDPNNESARQTMAHIFSGAEGDKDSEDVVVCSACGHINNRETAACAACNADLHLTCASCQRIVAISDAICIFCGCDPHGDRPRKSPGSPATSRISSDSRLMNQPGAVPASTPSSENSNKISSTRRAATPGGIKDLKATLKELEDNAKTNEAGGFFTAALEDWREVAKYRIDDPALTARIRNLEGRAHEEFVETQIKRGHTLRRSRHFWQALRTYRKVLRALSSEDRRAAPLQDLIAATERVHLLALGIYSAAFVILIILTVLVSRPYVLAKRFGDDLAILNQRVGDTASLPPDAGFTALAQMDGELTELDERANQLGRRGNASQAHADVTSCRTQIDLARTATVRALIKQATRACDQNNANAADQILTQLGALAATPQFSHDSKQLRERITRLRSSLADRERLRTQAPNDLEKATELEQNGSLGEALTIYRRVADAGHDQASPTAKESVARLDPQERAFLTEWDQMKALGRVDLTRAETECERLATRAVTWGRASELAQVRDISKRQLKAATDAWARIRSSSDLNTLEEFRTQFANTPFAGRALSRISELKQNQQLRETQRAAYATAIDEQRWEDAWQRSRSLVASGDRVPAPLRIESQPSGAEIRIAGEIKGRTPCTVMVAADLRTPAIISAPGWIPLTINVQESSAADWRLGLTLARAETWHLDLGRPVGALSLGQDGALLVQSADLMLAVDHGRIRWRCPLSTGDDLNAAQSKPAHTPQLLSDGRLALGLLGRDIAIIDSKGQLARRWAIDNPIHGRPISYTNELIGGGLRLAGASTVLVCGSIDGGDPISIPLAAPAVSGPLITSKDLDRLLVIANTRGQLVAIEESTRRIAWNYDTRAAEIGQLIPIGDDALVMILDSGRLACGQLTATGFQPRWTVPLGGTSIGDPIPAGRSVLVATDRAALRIDLDSGAVQSFPLPAPAATAPSSSGDTLAVGCRNGVLAVFSKGEAAWSTPLRALPQAVLCTPTEIVVGLVDGSVMSFAP